MCLAEYGLYGFEAMTMVLGKMSQYGFYGLYGFTSRSAHLECTCRPPGGIHVHAQIKAQAWKPYKP